MKKKILFAILFATSTPAVAASTAYLIAKQGLDESRKLPPATLRLMECDPTGVQAAKAELAIWNISLQNANFFAEPSSKPSEIISRLQATMGDFENGRSCDNLESQVTRLIGLAKDTGLDLEAGFSTPEGASEISDLASGFRRQMLQTPNVKGDQ